MALKKINFSTDLKVASTKFNKEYFKTAGPYNEIDYYNKFNEFLVDFYNKHVNKYSKTCF